MASSVAFRNHHVAYQAAVLPGVSGRRSGATTKALPGYKWVPTTRKASPESCSDSSDSERSSRSGIPTPSTDAGDDVSDRFPHSCDDTSSGAESDFGEELGTPPACRSYPAALLLQLRAALCGVRLAGPAAAACPPLGFGTKREAELVELNLVPTADASPTGVFASATWGVRAPSDQRGGADAVSWRQQALPLPPSSESSWAAQVQQRKLSSKAPEGSDDEKVARCARSILNKLTLDRFDPLYEQLAACGVETLAHVAVLMREIHEKATSQHLFASMYADLCARLEKDPRVAPAVESQQNAFRRLLLNECQAAFERLLKPQAESGLLDDEALALRKQRALGNVKFVGQLIVRGILSAKLLVACSEELLECWQSCGDALESLTALLPVACPTFDVESWPLKRQMDTIFNRMSELVASPAVPARTRFLLRDVLDMRAAGWPSQASAATKRPEPMTLEQVRGTPAASDRAGVVPAPPAASAAARAGAAKPLPDRTSLRAVAAEFTPAAKCDSLRAAAAEFTPAAKCGSLRAAAAEFTPAAACGSLRADAVEFAPAAKGGLKAPTPPTTPTTATPASSAPASPKMVPEASSPPEPEPPLKPFSLRDFHRELSLVMKDLGMDRNVAAAVRRVRAQNVPKAHQAAEFADVLTRAAEESRGPVRRSAFAFAAGLAASASGSAFDRGECLAGAGIFFREVYDDLCDEVPRLSVIASAELWPTLRCVLPEAQLRALLPEDVASQAK